MQKEQLIEEFIRLYGGEREDIHIFYSSGRVNLIGEHTDYNGGYVFPAALTLGTTLLLRKREGNEIRMKASDLPEMVSISIDNLDNYRDLKWGNYQAGVLYELQKAGYPILGCDLLYDDTVPHGSGLSSSAANEVVTAFAFISISGGEIDRTEIAQIAQKAENNYAGVKCGIMDQFASANGKANHAICLDCKSLSYDLVPISMEGYKLVITNTNKKHKLGESKYNERRAECEEGLSALKEKMPHVTCLGDVTKKDLEENEQYIKNPVVRNRVRHVVLENDRVLRSVEALKKGDIASFGEYMNASHDSLCKLYEVTGEELDTLAYEARRLPYVLGSRMTGAGFGGCTVSIVKEDKIDDFIKTVGEAYTEKIGYAPSFYISEIGDGAKEIL